MARLSAEGRKRWGEIDAVISECKSVLKSASTHEELKDFAIEHGFFNKTDFPKFKVSLRRIGVDYGVLREETLAAENETRAEELSNLAADAPCIRLWVAAMEVNNEASFAIVDRDHNAVWYGSFFDGDRIREVGDLVSAEQSVADKAVFVASKALEAHGGATIGKVIITTTCPALSISELETSALRKNLALEVIVDDEDLRAVDLAEAPGFQRYQDTNLAALVEVD